MFKKIFFSILLCSSSFLANAALIPADGVVDIWPSIPFVRGADLCRYKDAYGQTRTKYMESMVKNATDLLKAGAGRGAFDMLYGFNEMYDRNLDMATQYQYLDVTLESTFKAYLDSYYRDLRPRTQKVSFTNVNDIIEILRESADGHRIGTINNKMLAKLDYVAYGTYALAPNCEGDIQVTMHLIGRHGQTKSYVGSGLPENVMADIATQIFTEFQRTQFPSEVKIGKKTLTLVGGLNGSIDHATSTEIAVQSCEALEARLPSRFELEILNGFGDWSGGVSLNNSVWVLSEDTVYVPSLKNPSPVRRTCEINETEFLYYCVK